MGADYKNWVPRGMVAVLAVLAVFLFIAFCLVLKFSALSASIVFVGFVAVLIFFLWSVVAYRAFSYNGRRQLAKGIIDGIASYVSLPEGGSILDVGCGSGALSIAVAKKNPRCSVVGIDRWGREYASFSQELCTENAIAENVRNVSFENGDARSLIFLDGSFDAVVSNYVYHNISSKNREELLYETLRVLKKGGVFAIHDIMSRSKYGDIEAFAQRLRHEGYSEVRIVDTADGLFMTKREAGILMLRGSRLLVGRK